MYQNSGKYTRERESVCACGFFFAAIPDVLIFKLIFVFFPLCVCVSECRSVFISGGTSFFFCVHFSCSLFIIAVIVKRRNKNPYSSRAFLSLVTPNQHIQKVTTTTTTTKQNETGKQITYLWTHSDICVLPWLRLALLCI